MKQQPVAVTPKTNKGRLRRCLALTAVILAGLAALFLVAANLAVLAAGERIVTAEQAAGLDADFILVLGARLTRDGSPSPMLADRLLTGVSLYNESAAPKLLMSGDHGQKGYDEVNAMKSYALVSGVISADVFMDHAGFCTYDSLYRCRDIFAADKIIIVTQKYHLYRALYIAEHLGLEAYGVAADSQAYAGQGKRELREVLARAKDFLACLFQPQPALLGEVIPVSGDGDLTND
jgi:SanA protein